MAAVFKDCDCVVTARRCIVYACDIEGDGVGTLVKIYTAVCRAAVILYLEGEAGITGTVGICHRRKDQIPQVGQRYNIARRYRSSVQGKSPCSRHGGDLDSNQAVGSAVIRIGKAKVGGGKGVTAVFKDRDGLVRSRRSIVDRSDAHGQRVGAGTVVSAVIYLVPDGCVVRAVGVGCTSVAQFAGSDIGSGYLLVPRYINPVRAVVVLKLASTLQCGDLHSGDRRVFYVAIGAEISQRQYRRRVFEHRYGVVRRCRRIINRSHRSAQRYRPGRPVLGAADQT